MRKFPGHRSLLLVFAALAMLAMPMTVGAASAKKAPAAAKTTKVNKARSQAAKKGWETRRINQKAEANWASRIAKDPKANKPGAKDAFMKRSVASQRAWQKRKAAMNTKSSKKTGGKKAGGKKAAVKKAGGKKADGKKVAGKKADGKKADGKKVAGKKADGKKNKAGAAIDPENEIQSSVGAADFKTGLAKFDEARFHLSQGRNMDGAEAQMHGHDAMAQAAFDTANEYEKAGRVKDAKKLRAFGDEHLAKADALEQALDQAVAQARPQRGPVGRFFHWINPFKKRGGGDEQQPVAVAGQ
jgi:hypothetical protein